MGHLPSENAKAADRDLVWGYRPCPHSPGRFSYVMSRRKPNTSVEPPEQEQPRSSDDEPSGGPK